MLATSSMHQNILNKLLKCCQVKEVLVAATPMSATMGITKKELPQLQIRSGQTAFIVPPEVKTGQPVDVKLPMHWYCTSWGKGEYKLVAMDQEPDGGNGKKALVFSIAGSDGWWTMRPAA